MHLDSASAWCWLFVCTGTVALILVIVHLIHSLGTKRKVSLFYCWLGAIAVWGGALAFLLPIALNSGFGKDHDGSALRQALLYATGGVLAVITLGETHRKNSQEKEKNENDHIRQVHAERRSRYTTAVEQLANEKAPVRLGGIYTLTGLVDEWLADDSLTKEKQQEEGQVIINNLCSYIRSPFVLAEDREGIEYLNENLSKHWKNHIKGNEKTLKEEQEVRQTIFREMSKRIKQDSTTKKGLGWGEFFYDFSNSEIFYPLNELYFKNPNFSYSKFYGTANFYGSIFIDGANYTLSRFMGDAIFMESSFKGEVSFQEAKFHADAKFSIAGDQKSKFYNKAMFTRAKFGKYTDFSEVTFHETDFSSAEFHGNVHFLNTNFTEKARFMSSLFNGDIIDIAGCFTQTPDFHGALFNCNSEYNLFPTNRSIFYICDSPAKITSQTGKQINRRIPFGAKLFDPDSWDQKEQKYTCISETAKPFENSDTEEEKPTE